MANIDPRLGKQGEFRPQATLQGNPIQSPPASVLGLGDGWFVELDRNRLPHWRDLIEEVKAMIPKSTDKKRAKEVNEDENV